MYVRQYPLWRGRAESGSFAGLFGTTGNIIVNVLGSSLDLGVRGSDAANAVTLAQNATKPDLYLELSGNAAADVKVVGAPHSVAFTGSEKEITGSHRNEGCSVPSDGRPRSVRVDRSI